MGLKIIFNLGWQVGRVFPRMGATVNSKRGCDGNVVNREKTQEEAPSKR